MVERAKPPEEGKAGMQKPALVESMDVQNLTLFKPSLSWPILEPCPGVSAVPIQLDKLTDLFLGHPQAPLS